MTLETKHVSAPMNGREGALDRTWDTIFKNSGRKRENHGATPATHLLFGAHGDTQRILMAGI